MRAAMNNNIVKATITCVTKPDEEQLSGLKAFVCKKTGAAEAELEIVIDESLLGGFIIQIGNQQFDRSLRSKLEQLKESVAENAKQNNDTDFLSTIEGAGCSISL